MTTPETRPHSEALAEETIKELISAFVWKPVESRPYENCGELVYGGKMLTLFFDKDRHSGNTYLVRIDAPAIPQETRILYTAAKQIFEREAQKHGHALLYTLNTKNERMIHWAQTIGKEIFNWDEEILTPSKDGVIPAGNEAPTFGSFRKTFFPSSQV